MASKNAHLRTRKGNIPTQADGEKKHPKLSNSKQTKSTPKRASLVHTIDRHPKKDKKDGKSVNNGSTSQSEGNKRDQAAGQQPSNTSLFRASPAIRNDITQEKNRSRSYFDVSREPSKSPAMTPRSIFSAKSPRNHRSCDSPQSMSTQNQQHEFVEVSPEDAVDNSLSNATYTEDGSKHQQLSIDKRNYISDSAEVDINKSGNVDEDIAIDNGIHLKEKYPRKDTDDQITNNTSKQNMSVDKGELAERNHVSKSSDKYSRPNSALSKTSMSTRSKSAPHTRGISSRINSVLSKTDSKSRITSAGFRTKVPSRNNSKYKAVTNAKRNSAEIRIGSPSIKNVTFNNYREIFEFDEVNTSNNDQGTVEGSRTATPSNDASEVDIAGLTDRNALDKQQKEETGDADNRPSSCLTGDSSGRADIPSRGSHLMLGSGKVRKANDVETLELHFDDTDYSNLVSQKTSNMFCITGNTYSEIQNEKKASPRPVEVQLPKTYITRSGSLFLYSDSKIIKDKQRQVSDNSRRSDRTIEVQGRKMSPRTLVPQAYPYWGKLVNTKKGSSIGENKSWNSTVCSKRDQREYIGVSSRGSDQKPYSWNYTVLPVKLVDSGKMGDIKTVNNLSEAVLAYRSRSPTTEDKYLTMMKQTSHGKTQAERLIERAGQLKRLSNWTNEWIRDQTMATFGKNKIDINRRQIDGAERESDLIARLRDSLQQSVSCRAPVNTPLLVSKQQKGLNTLVGQLQRREVSKPFSDTASFSTAPSKSMISKYS